MTGIPASSREIIDWFIATGRDSATVDVENAGRSTISIYNGLMQYIKKHRIDNVTVRLVRGNIVLINNEKFRENPAVRPE